jgi:hypothetical protein
LRRLEWAALPELPTDITTLGGRNPPGAGGQAIEPVRAVLVGPGRQPATFLVHRLDIDGADG